MSEILANYFIGLVCGLAVGFAWGWIIFGGRK